MKFKRRPVERDTVDAIRSENEYLIAQESGPPKRMLAPEFEAMYEPLLRERKPKAAKPKKATKVHKESVPDKVTPFTNTPREGAA